MTRRIAAKHKNPVFTQPVELCKGVFKSITFYAVYRPVYSLLVCTSITVIYLILSNQKVQKMLSSLPYERYLAHFKSQRMITVYATVVEVIFELLMAAVLAGVSVIVTMWLVFEEMADRRTSYRGTAGNKYEEKESLSVLQQTSFSSKDLHRRTKEVSAPEQPLKSRAGSNDPRNINLY